MKLLVIFGARVNSLDSGFQTPLDVAVECNDERVIALLQKLGGVQGELVKAHHFNAVIPRLNTFHDVAKIKAQVVKVRVKSRRTLANRNAYCEPAGIEDQGAVVFCAGMNGSSSTVEGREGSSDDARMKGNAVQVRNDIAQGNGYYTSGDDGTPQVNGCGLHIGNGVEGHHMSGSARGNSHVWNGHGACRSGTGIALVGVGEEGGCNGKESSGEECCPSVVVGQGSSAEQRNGNLDAGQGSCREELRERLFSNQSLSRVTLRDMEDGNTLSTLYERLQQCINMTYDLSGGCLWSRGLYILCILQTNAC